MKIKGVAGNKHPNPKLRRGDPILLSPEEKAKVIASETVIALSEEGFRRIPIKEEVIGTVQVIRGRSGIKKPEPDQYVGTVKVIYKRLKLDGDKLFPEKAVTIKVQFKDSTDDIGMPDLKLVSHELK